MRSLIAVRSLVILGCAALLLSSFSPLGPATAASAEIPKIKIKSPVERDADGCITITIEGSKFPAGEWSGFFQEVGSIGGGDVSSEGELFQNEKTICTEGSISLGRHTVTVLTPNGAGAVKVITVVDKLP